MKIFKYGKIFMIVADQPAFFWGCMCTKTHLPLWTTAWWQRSMDWDWRNAYDIILFAFVPLLWFRK